MRQDHGTKRLKSTSTRNVLLARFATCLNGCFCYSRHTLRQLCTIKDLFYLIIIFSVTVLSVSLFLFERRPAGRMASITDTFQFQDRSVSPNTDRQRLVPAVRNAAKSVGKAPYSWPEKLRRTCKEQNISMDIETLKVGTYSHIFVDDKLKVLYCAIPYTVSTTWKRILLEAFGKSRINASMAMPQTEVHTIFSRRVKSLDRLSSREISYALRNYFKFMMVRDPLERVLSAYRDKLWNMTARGHYFQKTIGRQIIKMHRSNPSELSLQNGHDVSFQEFVDYLNDQDIGGLIHSAWSPFHQLCNPCIIQYDFVGKLSRINKDSAYILDKLGVTDKVKITNMTELYSYPKLETLRKQYFATLTRASISKLYNRYKLDYMLFNFPKQFPRK